MPEKRKPTRRTASHAGTTPYSRSTYAPRARKKSSALPFVAAIVVIVVIIVAVAFCMRACSGNSSKPAAQTQSTEMSESSSTQQTATKAPEGRITMTLGGDEETIVLVGEDYLEAGCHVWDKKDGDLTSKVTTESTVDTSTAGDYTVTYTVTNNENMQATKTRTVHVVSKMDADTDGISVMMYHYVYDPSNPPENLSTNWISTTKLAKELKWLVKEDYYFPSYQELRAYVEGTHSLPKKSVVLTFDDATKDFMENGIPLLEKYKVPATSFVICDRKGMKKRIHNHASEYVTFQSHSYGLHNPGTSGNGHGGKIWDLTQKQIEKDLKRAAKFLGTNDALAFPYGDISDAGVAAVKAVGILCAFSTEYGQVHKGDNPAKLSRIRVFGDGAVDGFKYQVKNGA